MATTADKKDLLSVVALTVQDRQRGELSGHPGEWYVQFPTLTGCASCHGLTGYMLGGKVVKDRAVAHQLGLIQWGFHVGRHEGHGQPKPVYHGGGRLPQPCTCTCDHQWTITRHDMHTATWLCDNCGDSQEVDSSG